MKISGLEKLTLQDYPEHVACIIFTQGCNFSCRFCHNADLIACNRPCKLNEEDILAYLDSRKQVLDGVVISGGEPLLQEGIKDFIKAIKDKGLKVKIDTNGTNYKMLKELIDENLIDYVAMDVKADENNYGKLIGRDDYDYERVQNAINILKASNIDYEFRTTIIKEYHDLLTLESICKFIGEKSKYYLQNFVNSEKVLNKELHGFSRNELLNIERNLNQAYPNVKVRGL